MPASPVVSVILPVLNEAKDLGGLLRQLEAQDMPHREFEVLVVDGGSTDATRDIVRSMMEGWTSLRLLDNPLRLSGAARNIGARAGSGRVLLYVDGHCSVPNRHYLTRLVEIFQSSGADCLCRPQPLVNLAEGSWGRAIALARHSPIGHKPGSEIYATEPGYADPRSAGAAYTRHVLETLGGFDERFDACEDVEFNHRVDRAGFTAYFHPDLAVDYRPRSSLKGLFRQMMRYGRGRAHLMLRHRLVPWLLVVPACLGLLLVAGMVAFPKPVVPLATGLAALWLVLLAVEGFRLGGAPSPAARIALALAAVHVGLLAGFLRGLGEFQKFRPLSGGRSPNPGSDHAYS